MERPLSQADVNALGWYHTIDLGGGIVTPGQSDTTPLDGDRFPDVKGKTVLDIGAWDGYYSFEAEKRGASRIVALDHYVWCIDFGARTEYWNSCKEQGIIPDLDRDEVDFWHPDAPGKRGFDFAREALNSSVEDVVADFMTIDLESLGSFDVVFYLGVLYHVREPFLALRRLREATREVAVVETVAVAVEHHTEQPLLAFYAGDDLSADYGNWFAPSEKALHNMLRAAGFSRVETKAGPAEFEPPPTPPLHQRLRQPPAPRRRLNTYRLVVHAFV
jgi:tRNA (mo5U34)-methyltransferase